MKMACIASSGVAALAYLIFHRTKANLGMTINPSVSLFIFGLLCALFIASVDVIFGEINSSYVIASWVFVFCIFIYAPNSNAKV